MFFYVFPSLLLKFNFNISSHPRRLHSLVLPPVGKHVSRSFLFKFAIAWNNLPLQIRAITSKHKFKLAIESEFAAHKYSTSGIQHIFS